MLSLILCLSAISQYDIRAKSFQIKVLIDNNVSSALLNTSSYFDFYGSNLGKIKSLTLRALPEKVVIANRWVAKNPLTTRSDTSIKYKNIYYPGVFKIYAKNGKLAIINKLDLEEYVKTVVCSEMMASWPLEALKTQAVVSRTIGLYHILKGSSNKLWDIGNSTKYQVYSGLNVRKKSCILATDLTKGKVLIKDGKIVQLFFHSNSGGMVEESSQIWHQHLPYLKSGPTNYGKTDPNYYWQRRFSKQQIASALRKIGFSASKIRNIIIQALSPAKRVKKILVLGDQTISISGENLRQALGYSRLPSSQFTIRKLNDSFIFKGAGFGHGVGLCQWCAKEMAIQNKKFNTILKNFFTGLAVKRYY